MGFRQIEHLHLFGFYGIEGHLNLTDQVVVVVMHIMGMHGALQFRFRCRV